MIGAMTAKQELYLAAQSGDLDIRKFCQAHRSVQWRSVGKAKCQVRFNDRESWIDIEAFCDNYRNKLLKDIGDRISQARNILTHEDVLSAIPSVIVGRIESEALETRLARGTIVTRSSVKDLEQKAGELQSKVAELEEIATTNYKAWDNQKQRAEANQKAFNDLVSEVEANIGMMGLSKKDWTAIRSKFNVR